MKTVQIRRKTYQGGNKLKSVSVFYPQSNKHEAALLDEDNKLVGFDTDRVYHPAGGARATQEIASQEQALVDGSEYWQYDARHCYGNVYVLNSL